MYLPPKEADLNLWVLNFDTLLTAAPATYGETAPVALAVHTPTDAFIAALSLATDPGTRTHSTIAAKDAAKAAMLAALRPVATRIKANAGVSDASKVAIGVGVKDTALTPISTPTTQPLLSIVRATPLQHEIRFADAMTPDKRHKPFGATALILFCSVGSTPPAIPENSPFKALVTKQPYFHGFDVGDVGKIAFYYGRWVTRTGLLGPMSAVASMTVA
jgi:hypothetical protein